MKMRTLWASAALLASLTLAAPAPAQQQQSQQNDQNQSPQQNQARQRDHQQSPSRRRDTRPMRSPQQDNQARWRLEPEGWITIAVDRDGDGRFDAVETIHAYDLQRARQASRRRQDQQYASQYRAQRRQESQMNLMDERQMFRVQGKLADTRTIQLRGAEGKELIGRVQTQEGRVAKVALGPKNQLEKLNLQEGDPVTVLGQVGAINDRAMLIARDVQANGDTVRVERPPAAQGLRHFSGEIEKTRTAKLRNVDQKQTVARVRLNEGPTLDVILGPQEDMEKLNLRQGDQVAFLGYKARLDRRPALVAEEVAAHGEVVKNELSDRERFRDNRRQDQRRH